MVVKLTGKVNGETVLFQRIRGDVWETRVPSSLNGTYVLDMTAYDEAGNETYWAKYILTVDLAYLCAHLSKHPYQAEILKPDYTFELDQFEKKYHANVVDELIVELKEKEYFTELLKGRCDLDDVCRI